MLTDEQELGVWQKPLDWSDGHSNYLVTTYQLLNAIQATGLKPGSTIVEVGSDAGWTTEILAGLGCDVVCLEPADVMLKWPSGSGTTFGWCSSQLRRTQDTTAYSLRLEVEHVRESA